MGLGTKTFGGIKIGSNFGAGAAVAADITITGIALADTILCAFEIQPPTAATGNTFKTDLFSEITITAANTVRCSTTNTTGNQVFVIWMIAN
jgi:hypothetical protein